MDKITLKEYKKTLEQNTFKALGGYSGNTSQLKAALIEKNFTPEQLKNNHNFSSKTRSASCVHTNLTIETASTFEYFHTGNEYFKFSHNNLTFLIHEYEKDFSTIKVLNN